MIEHSDSLSQFFVHAVAQHLYIARTASALYLVAFEASFDRVAVVGPIKTVHEPVFGLVVADATDLDGIICHYGLVNDSIELNQVLPV